MCHYIWQFVHRFGGRAAILLGLANGSLGVFMAVAVLPVIIAWHAWLGLLLLLLVLGEMAHCVVKARRNGSMGAGKTADRHADNAIINGWEKTDSYINATTESIRL